MSYTETHMHLGLISPNTSGHKHGRVPAKGQPEHADNTNSSCMCQKHTSSRGSQLDKHATTMPTTLKGAVPRARCTLTPAIPVCFVIGLVCLCVGVCAVAQCLCLLVKLMNTPFSREAAGREEADMGATSLPLPRPPGLLHPGLAPFGF